MLGGILLPFLELVNDISQDADGGEGRSPGAQSAIEPSFSGVVVGSLP